jgi:predicted small lipoprotein YifL
MSLINIKKSRASLVVLLFLSALAGCGNPKAMQKAEEHPDHKPTSTMNKQDFTTSIEVSQSPSTVFNAIKNFRGWWSDDIEGETGKLNETFFYHYKDVHLCKLKLIEAIPDQKLVYQVVDNQFNFTKDKTEWIGTKLIFDISKDGEKTKMQFTHEGLVPEYECYNVCTDAWTSYIQGSLKSLIETGKGKPNPKEGGLNAELVEKWGLPKK